MIASWVRTFVQGREDRRPLFERLMTESYRQAYNMALRLCGSSTEAEDLVQETYVRAYRFFYRYDETLPFVSWLYRIMVNIHIDDVRRRQRLRTVSLDHGTGTGASWEISDNSALADATLMETTLEEPLQLGLKSMNPEFRTAVVLADVEGMSYEEIAEIMDTSVGTVRSRIHRGRRQLKEYLERLYPGQYEVTA